MKDIETILESGILVRYLLGELSLEETIEVENYLEKHKVLKDYLDELEVSFETIAAENSIAPPPSVKSSVLNSLKVPAVEAKVKSLNSSNKPVYLALVAFLAVLFFIGGIWMFTQLQTIENQLEVVQQEKQELNDEFRSLRENLIEKEELVAVINDPNTKKIVMQGNALSPKAKAITYLNTEKQIALLNTAYLPELSKDKDYQMWADVDGEMINMGVIPKGEAMVALQYIPAAASLNITIEPSGGSEHPTVSRLISNVYL